MEAQDRIGYLIKKIDLTFKQVINEKLKDYGLTQTQSDLLLYLNRNQDHEISQRELEKFLNCTNPTVTGILNRLEKNGFIIRRASLKDARSKIIIPSDKAGKMYCEIKGVIAKNEERLLSLLNEEEKMMLHMLLRKLLQSIQYQNEKEENI